MSANRAVYHKFRSYVSRAHHHCCVATVGPVAGSDAMASDMLSCRFCPVFLIKTFWSLIEIIILDWAGKKNDLDECFVVYWVDISLCTVQEKQ